MAKPWSGRKEMFCPKDWPLSKHALSVMSITVWSIYTSFELNVYAPYSCVEIPSSKVSRIGDGCLRGDLIITIKPFWEDPKGLPHPLSLSLNPTRTPSSSWEMALTSRHFDLVFSLSTTVRNIFKLIKGYYKVYWCTVFVLVAWIHEDYCIQIIDLTSKVSRA